jgi:type III restriction enzyme
MPQKTIPTLIVNSPFKEPTKYWRYIRETQDFELVEGSRRAAGYWRRSKTTVDTSDDPGDFVSIELVNIIRQRVRMWRESGYTNCTGVTRKLLGNWSDKEQRAQPLFFCQLEAVETAIWLVEAPESEKQGVDIAGDGSEWQRVCLKLATGTGKTVVMAMLIAWQVLNKLAYPQDTRFSRNILVIAPGLTVRDRLQVLRPENPENYYQAFGLVDSAMWQQLQLAARTIEITNWHTLAPFNENYGPKLSFDEC